MTDASSRHAAWANRVFVGLVAMVCLWGIWQAQRIMRADFFAAQARYQIGTWVAGSATWTPAQWDEAKQALLESAQVAPDNPQTFDYLGLVFSLRGRQVWDDSAARRSYFLEARRFQERSLALRPEHGAAWASLAFTHYALGESAEQVQAMRQALRFAPNELQVNLLLAELVLANWTTVPEDLRAWLLERLVKGPMSEKQDIVRLMRRYGVSLGK